MECIKILFVSIYTLYFNFDFIKILNGYSYSTDYPACGALNMESVVYTCKLLVFDAGAERHCTRRPPNTAQHLNKSPGGALSSASTY